jgi:predicted transcriptional regulator
MSREGLQDLVFKLRKEGYRQVKIAEISSISQARVSQILNNPVEGEFAK